MNIIEAISDPRVFGKWLHGFDMTAWRWWHGAVHGLPIPADKVEVVFKATGRTKLLGQKATLVGTAAGRQCGKSTSVAIEVVFSCCIDTTWRKYVAKGQRPVFGIFAVDRRQGQEIKRYCSGILRSSPLLRGLIEKETAEQILLSTGCSVEVRAANFRSARGPSYLGAVLDECAFMQDEATMSNPSSEIVVSIKPALIKGGTIYCISSVYGRSGLLWDLYERHFGHDDDEAFFWLADTLTMRPSFPREKIERELGEDAVRANAEYFSVWRDDSAALFSGESVDLCIVKGRGNLPYKPRLEYRAFCDPSGGQHDAFALAIGHLETKRTDEGLERTVKIVDFVKEARPPFSPSAVVYEFSEILKQYGLFRLSGDRYGCAWVSEVFRQCGIHLEYSELASNELYLNLLAEINSGGLELPDDKALRLQLLSLLRKPGQAGHDRVIAPATNNGHCDLANSVAGVAHLLQKRRQCVFVIN